MRRLIPRWRKMTWVLLIWTAIFAVWIVGGVNDASGHTHAYCVNHASQFLSVKDCETASDAGTAIGATLVFILWFLGFVVLGLVWLMPAEAAHVPALRHRRQEGPHHVPELRLRLRDAAGRRRHELAGGSVTQHWGLTPLLR